MSRHAAVEEHVPTSYEGEPLFFVDEPLPPDELVDQVDDVAGRLSASSEAGVFRPIPVVAVGEPLADVASGRVAGAPLPGLLVVDDVSVRWGRSEILQQPSPATARLALFDSTKLWATSRDLIGRRVTVRYQATKPGLGQTSVVFFSGRIATVRVAAKTVQLDDASLVEGSLVTITATSVVNDLANRKPAEASWPNETMAARRSRVAAYCAGVLDGGVELRSFWLTPEAAPDTSANTTSIYDHLVNLYDSAGADRISFVPSTRKATFLPRRDYFNARGLAGLWWNVASESATAARAAKGIYIRSYGVQPAGAAARSVPLYLDGHSLEYDPSAGIERELSSRVSNVALDYYDVDGAYARRTITKTVPGANTAIYGERAATLRTVLAWNSYADTCASDLVDFVRKEGAQWRTAPLRWSTRRTDGFENYDQVEALLLGAETTAIVFFQRTFLSEYGLRPIFGIMGGTIGYSRGGWDLDLELATISTTLPQHAVTWEEIDDGSTTYQVEWHDEPHFRAFHESVTYEDLGYCATGLNVANPGPDVGYDAAVAPLPSDYQPMPISTL